MTPAQEKFLREFAVRLGWEETAQSLFITVNGVRELSHLVTPSGQAYLVNRAREAGFGLEILIEQDMNYVRIWRRGGLDDLRVVKARGANTDLSLATALAVAKALFGLEMEEG